jgi:hypothetical protein
MRHIATPDKNEEEQMTVWNDHQTLGEEFLIQHHNLVLYDVYHHIKAFLLFPPNCSCENSWAVPNGVRRLFWLIP